MGRRCQRGEVQRLLSLQKSSSVSACYFFFFYWFSKEPQLSVVYMLERHACKLPCVDVCFVWSQDVFMCNVAQLSSTIFFILFLLQTLQNLKAPVCKIKRHLMAENDIARKKNLLIFLFM